MGELNLSGIHLKTYNEVRCSSINTEYKTENGTDVAK